MNIFAGNTDIPTISTVEEFESEGKHIGLIAAVELSNNNILHVNSITTLRINKAANGSVLILNGSLNIIDMCYIEDLIIVNKGNNNILINNTESVSIPIIKVLDKGTFRVDNKYNITKIDDYKEYMMVSIKCTPEQLDVIENLGC